MKILKLNIILISFSLSSVALAQNAKSVKGSATDKSYGNTTQIYRAENASDKQILDEVSKEYGIGEVVYITDAPANPTPQQLETKSVKLSENANIKPVITTLQSNSTISNTDKPLIPNNKKDIPEYSEEDDKEMSNPLPTSTKKVVHTEGVSTLKNIEEANAEMTISNGKTTSIAKNKTTTNTSKKSYTAKKTTRKAISSSKASRHKRVLFFFKKKDRKTMKIGVHKRKKEAGCYKF